MYITPESIDIFLQCIDALLKIGTLWKNGCITKIHDALQKKKTGTRNLQTGPRNHKQEPLLFLSSKLPCVEYFSFDAVHV